MDIKFGSGLDFVIDDSAKNGGDSVDTTKNLTNIQEIIREGYRAPVGNDVIISLKINEKKYQVFNLGAKGVGVYLNDLAEFSVGDLLRNMDIEINGKKFKVDGRVVHISQDESNCLCGLELSSMDKKCANELVAYLQKSKSVLLP